MKFDSLKVFLIAVGILGFVCLQGYFLIEILKANATPPNFSEALVGIGAGLTGVLGAAFAVALGVKDQAGNPAAVAFTRDSTTKLLTAGIWTYALVGLASTIVYAFNTAETPGSISSLALVFVGYVLAVITNAYKAALVV